MLNITSVCFCLAILESDIRLPQTFKVVFGGEWWTTFQVIASRLAHIVGAGCHDTGYINVLTSLMTDGWTHKLILLRGYDEMAAGFKELNLPIFPISDLFMHQKIVIDRMTQSARRASVPSNVHSPAERPRSDSVHQTIVDSGGQARQFSSPSPPSYTAAVQRARSPAISTTPTLNVSDGMAASGGADDGWKVKSKASVSKQDGNKRSTVNIVCLLLPLLILVAHSSV